MAHEAITETGPWPPGLQRRYGESRRSVLGGVGLALGDLDPARPLDDDGDRTGLDGFHRMIGQSPAIRSRLRATWDETEDALTDALAQPQDGPRERADHRFTAAQLMVLVRTVTSQEVRASVAEAAGGSTAAERQALRDWIPQAAGRLAQGLKAVGR